MQFKRSLPILQLFLLISTLMTAQTNWLTGVNIKPTNPVSCDIISMEVKGNLPATNYAFSSASVNQAGTQLAVDVYFASSGFGLPTITPFTQNVTIGTLAAATYSYTVRLYFNGSQVDSSSGGFSVTSGSSSVNLVNDTSFCSGDSVQLDAGTSGAVSYTWSSGGKDSVTTISAGGTYWVEADLGNNCVVTDTFVVTEIPLPVVDLGPDTTLCEGNTLLLDVTNPGASYIWQNSNTSATFKVKLSGTYWVEVTKKGCVNSDTAKVTVNPTPQVDLGKDTMICKGDSLELKTNASAGAQIMWQDGSTSSNFMVHASGTYWVQITEENCSNTDTIHVTERPGPTVDLGPDTTIAMNDSIKLSAGVHSNYLWNTGEVSADIWATAGVYIVTVTDSYGCESTDTVEVSYATGIATNDPPARMLYPNPATGQIRISGIDQPVQLVIRDMSGKVVRHEMLVPSKNDIKLELNTFPAGMYQVILSNQEGTTQDILIIQRP